MNLIYYPNAFLDKQVKPFDIDNPPVDPKELKDNMVQVMLDNHGIGLSANQVEFDGQVCRLAPRGCRGIHVHCPDFHEIILNRSDRLVVSLYLLLKSFSS